MRRKFLSTGRPLRAGTLSPCRLRDAGGVHAFDEVEGQQCVKGPANGVAPVVSSGNGEGEEGGGEARPGHHRNVVIQRYKGLGVMNPDQLWKATIDPATRTILKVEMEDAFEATQLFEVLMGDEVESRRKFIEEHAKFVRNLDV